LLRNTFICDDSINNNVKERGIMAIDFDALDLVRTKNKAKRYEQKKREQLLKRVDDIKQKLLKPIFNGCNDQFYEMWLNKAHKYYNDTLFKK